MKKYILLIFLAAVTARSQTAFTNGVKGSLWVNASTPLDGTEKVYAIQSGVSKLTTVGQINNAPLTAVQTASNFLALVIGTNAATANAASNLLAKISGTNTASILATSNFLALVAGTNAAAITAASASFSAALTGYYSASNPSGFQNAAQVAAAASAAVASYASSGVTNGGTATLSNVVYSVRDNGLVTNSIGTFTVDLSAASLQVLTVTNASNGNGFSLAVTNIAPGQNVTLLIKFPLGSGNNLLTHTVSAPAGMIYLNSAGNVAPNLGKSVIANFTSTGTTASGVVVGFSVQQ